MTTPRTQRTPPTSSAPIKKPRKPRSKLGRGLSALVEQAGSTPIQIGSREYALQNASNNPKPTSVLHDQPAQPPSADQVIELSVLDIVPNTHQPRRVFPEEALEELSRSIIEHGLMQPIVVRRVDQSSLSGQGERYELIAGERRWRATCQAGLTHIRSIVCDVDDAQSAQLALIENIQREDLNPIERANGFALLSSRFAMTQEQIASKVGISRSAVANTLRLIELDEEIQSMIASGQLSAGHGKALLSCQDLAYRTILANLAAKEGWTVRLLEKATASRQNTPPNIAGEHKVVDDATRISSVLRDLETRLGEQLSTKVKLKTDRSGTRGSILIEFYDLDHFDGLMNRLGIQEEDQLRTPSSPDREHRI